MAFLVTKTLVNAWNYAMNARDEVQEDAYREFLDVLHRKPMEITPELRNGMEFEDAVYREARGEPRAERGGWEDGIKAAAGIIRDAPVQIRLSRPMRIPGYEILVYGILDAMKAGTIYDVKYLNKSFGSAELAGKYMDSPQHPAYLYLAPEAMDFVYIVSDGVDLYTERYTRKTSRPFGDIVSEFLAYLRAADLMDMYREKWTAR